MVSFQVFFTALHFGKPLPCIYEALDNKRRGLGGGGCLAQELSEHLVRRLPHVPPRSLANTLAAMEALGHVPPPALLHAVAAHVRSQLHPSIAAASPEHEQQGVGMQRRARSGPGMPLRDLSLICHSLAVLGLQADAEWAAAVAGAAAGFAAAGPDLRAAFDGDADDEFGGPVAPGGPMRLPQQAATAEGEAARTAAAHGAHAHHLALLTAALSRLRHPLPPRVWPVLLQGLLSVLHAAAPESLAALLTAAARLRLPLSREATGALLLATHRRLGAMSPACMAAVLQSFVKLGVDPGGRWLGAMEEELRQRQWRWVLGRSRAAAAAAASAAGGQDGGSRDGSEGEEADQPQAAEGAATAWMLPGPRERAVLLWAVVTLETAQPRGTAPALATAAGAAMAGRGGARRRAPLLPSGTAARAGSNEDSARPDEEPCALPSWEMKPPAARRQGLQHDGLLELLLLPPSAELMAAAAAEAGAATSSPSTSPSFPLRPRDAASMAAAQAAEGMLLQQQLRSLCGADLAVVCWALGRLRLRPRGLVRALLPELLRRLRSTQPNEPSPAAGPPASLPAADATEPVPAAAAVARGLGRGLLDSRSLATACWGLSSMGLWPPVEWQAAVAEEALRRLAAGQLAPRECATLAAALARWSRQPASRRHQQEEEQASGSSSAADSDGEAGAGGKSEAKAAVRRVRAERRLRAAVRRLSALALEHTAARLPGLLAPLTPAPSQQQQQEQQPQPQCYDARSLSWLLWAVAALGCVRELPAWWTAAFLPGGLRLLAQLAPSHRVTLLDSLSRLGLRPGAAWLERAEQVRGGAVRAACGCGGDATAGWAEKVQTCVRTSTWVKGKVPRQVWRRSHVAVCEAAQSSVTGTT